MKATTNNYSGALKRIIRAIDARYDKSLYITHTRRRYKWISAHGLADHTHTHSNDQHLVDQNKQIKSELCV